MSQINTVAFTSSRVSAPKACMRCFTAFTRSKRLQTPLRFHAQPKKLRGTLAAYTTESPVADEQVPDNTMPVEDLKAVLLDSLFGLERGLTAKGEARAELNELIGQLEGCNPTPSPTEAVEMLSGNWKLVYTTSPSVLVMIGLSKLPLVKIGDITQMIDGPGMTVENKIQITVPFSRTSFSTSASFDVSSPKRLRLRYDSGNISTPELLEDIDFPDSVSILGQTVDLSPLNQALQPFSSTVKDAVAQLGNILSQQPDLKIPIQEDRAPVTWLLTTFLDGDTRISRGDGGTVYIFVKDVSFEDSPAEVGGEMEESPAVESVGDMDEEATVPVTYDSQGEGPVEEPGPEELANPSVVVDVEVVQDGEGKEDV